MIKKLLKIIFVLTLSTSIYGQQTNDVESKEKTNPIIYAELFGGFSAMDHVGFSGGVELNYQYKKSLFSLRYANATGYISNEINPFFPFPTYYKSEDNSEYALLYGRRWMSERRSFSVSAGISCNNLDSKRRFIDEEAETYGFNQKYETFYGVPFEASYKWFYKKKRSKLIYNALIPSIGAKIFGNISKNSYIGFGLSIGLGFSKEYK
ncbi:hypothetical protein IRZ71_15340 [Flavobacterium sp. ANB]|uniref:hypothetical protein n=1 Tax=unclassified Flavobacterium TaxID=196869 RepID=UPI0012B6E292|nr:MULTISPECIES: hypothetical protein [unclassified Flavobacterium]MBF4517738.1 hypothetical protein [Flavobacterium sp. ANB]MTD70465.1 hypothetical protein [Flavobacterium sp. LC2016-13]